MKTTKIIKTIIEFTPEELNTLDKARNILQNLLDEGDVDSFYTCHDNSEGFTPISLEDAYNLLDLVICVEGVYTTEKRG